MSNALEPDSLHLSLQSQIDSLTQRVKELEADNSNLSSLLSKCQCQTDDEKGGSGLKAGIYKKGKKHLTGWPSGCAKAMGHCSKRYVALKIMYFGLRFYGFSSEAQMDPTVESELFRAFEKTRLLVGDKKESQYYRCGRTDRGVSSVGQVISLYLRSNLKEVGSVNKSATENSLEKPHESCSGEIDYVKVLNKVLPKDIRVLGWCSVPESFSARFSCLSREYKYFFWKENLNLLAMEKACEQFVGEHDFRNFCKMDALNVHNYRRHITSCEIYTSNKRLGDNQLCEVRMKGSAFLWHQVRCMVAVLFLIGQGLESHDMISELLDTERIPKKPQYAMAPEMPLVLQSCNFDGVRFTCSSDARQALHEHFKKERRNYELQAAIVHEALLSCSSVEDDQISLQSEMVKKRPSYIPLMARALEPSYEERRAKLGSRGWRS